MSVHSESTIHSGNERLQTAATFMKAHRPRSVDLPSLTSRSEIIKEAVYHFLRVRSVAHHRKQCKFKTKMQPQVSEVGKSINDAPVRHRQGTWYSGRRYSMHEIRCHAWSTPAHHLAFPAMSLTRRHRRDTTDMGVPLYEIFQAIQQSKQVQAGVS